MNKEQTYHIDVTEEEALLFVDPPVETKKSLLTAPANFTKVLFLVLGVHVAIAAIIFGTSQSVSAKEADKKILEGQPIAEATACPTPNVSSNSTVDAPKPTTPSVQNVAQEPVVQKPEVKQQPATKTDKKKYTTNYVVKQGDTVTSIAKKFKLNTDRLMKINNIKNPNKIEVGQTLKFL